MNNDVMVINNDVTYPCVKFMQIDTKDMVVMYDVTIIKFDDIKYNVYVTGKTSPDGTNRRVEMYNTRIVYKEEDDL